MTGSSSGIGFGTSVLLARNGFHTYSTVRNLENSQALVNVAKKDGLPLQVIKLDVRSDTSVRDGVNSVLDENKRIDVIVNNAGYALVGAFEDLSMDEIKSQFETNFFGAIRVIQAVLPTMRDHRKLIFYGM